MSDSIKSNNGLLTFTIGGCDYAVEVRYVLEIIETPRLTVIPGQPRYLKGLFAYKGAVVPVISMSELCGVTGSDEGTCLILQYDNGGMTALSITKANDITSGGGANYNFDREKMENGLLKFTGISRGENMTFVLDIKRTFENLRMI